MDAISTADFDQYNSIRYEGITKLFWDKYPYKVFVKHGRLVRPDTKKLDPISKYKALDKYETKKKAFVYNRQAHCPQDDTTWKMVSSSGETAFSYYFVHAADALHFIEKSRSYVKTVHRPEHPSEISALIKERTGRIKPTVRDMLFWNKYRWRIEFKRLPRDEEMQVDSFVRDTYLIRSNGSRKSLQQQKVYYSISNVRCLYLQNENDVVLTMLGVSEYIAEINKVLLKEEIYEY